MKRGFALCPELAPPEIRAHREPVLEDLQSILIEEGCGLRPARKGGIRLEVEWADGPDQRKVPVVFNYGCVLAFENIRPFLTRLYQTWRIWLPEFMGFRHCSARPIKAGVS